MIGVLALQGAYRRHLEVLEACGAKAREVRSPADLEDCSGLVLPGGESTTVGKLLRSAALFEPLGERLAAGMPVLGTCAGMILLAREVLEPGPNDQEPFAAIDIAVRRNAFGRQVESFESDLDVTGLEGGPLRAVFIRAPVVAGWGPAVEVLAWQNGQAVMACQGAVIVCAFHPELTGDRRIHQQFLDRF